MDLRRDGLAGALVMPQDGEHHGVRGGARRWHAPADGPRWCGGALRGTCASMRLGGNPVITGSDIYTSWRPSGADRPHPGPASA